MAWHLWLGLTAATAQPAEPPLDLPDSTMHSAMWGELEPEGIAHIEDQVARQADPHTRARYSMLLLTDTYARGDRDRLLVLAERHYTQLEPDGSLALAMAVRLDRWGSPPDQVLRWTERARAHPEDWMRPEREQQLQEVEARAREGVERRPRKKGDSQ